MFRVITQYRNCGSPLPIIERGPWHATQETARYWADILRAQGYAVDIEDQDANRLGNSNSSNPGSKNKDNELAAALAMMA